VDKKNSDFRQNDENVEIHKKGLKKDFCIAIICDLTDGK
jgi:hypothetical protein